VLFVGEAPPASGTFFYAGNSQVYRYLREALQFHLGDPGDFLEGFADRGYFLDDLVTEPVDHVPRPTRRSIYEKCVPVLAARMTAMQPQIVVSILISISPFVQRAIALSDLDVPHYRLPFPGTGQQGNFRRRIGEILPLLP
jgi:hypothetical protein